jgi:N-acyl-D-amino-acid deacylase
MNFSENKDKAHVLLSMVDEYLSKGVDVTLDTYPYLPGCTTLAALLPSWTSSGGSSEVLKHLRNPESRARIRQAVEVDGCDGGHGIPTNWDEIQVGQISHDESIKHYSGRLVSEIAEEEGKPAMEVFFEILEKDRLATNCLMHVGHEDNVQAIMQHRTHVAGSDAILHGEKVHPRAFGTMTRYLGEYHRSNFVIRTAVKCDESNKTYRALFERSWSDQITADGSSSNVPPCKTPRHLSTQR